MTKGNTKSFSKKKQIQGKSWCFTLNNYDITDITKFSSWPEVSKGMYGKEVGENGTPHLQGTVTFKKNTSLTALKKLDPRIHWEKTRAVDASFEYCRKEGEYNWFKTDVEFIAEEALYHWQKEILDMSKTKPDRRKIYWYWEPDGCTGKTEIAKQLCYKHGALLIGGGAKDIASRVIQSGRPPKIVVMNLTRTKEKEISWEAIESLKDGLIQSGKYEGGQLVFNPPHVFIFANFSPDESVLSADRWDITRIGQNDDIINYF